MNLQESIFSWYDVPEDIKNLLLLAAENWENTLEAQEYINQALDKAGNNTDVLVSAYRFFFYKRNYQAALKITDKVLDKIEKSEHLPEDWKQLKPILISRQDEPQIRLYLSTYAASGFIFARLGEVAKAKELTQKIKEINNTSEFAAATVSDVLTRPLEEEDY